MDYPWLDPSAEDRLGIERASPMERSSLRRAVSWPRKAAAMLRDSLALASSSSTVRLFSVERGMT
jgi:hypothetical protein